MSRTMSRVMVAAAVGALLMLVVAAGTASAHGAPGATGGTALARRYDEVFLGGFAVVALTVGATWWLTRPAPVPRRGRGKRPRGGAMLR